MKNIFRTKAYWILAFLATAVIFLALIDANRAYKSEVDVLILSKNAEVEKNINQITLNAGKLPLTLSFYDKLLKNNPEIKDDFSGLSNLERKSRWNSQLQTEKLNDSAIIRITVLNKNQEFSKTVAQASALELANDLSRFYNIKTDIDVRIIDGPVTGQAVRYGYPVILSLSLILSLASIYISFAFSSWMEKTSLTTKPVKKQTRVSPDYSQIRLSSSPKTLKLKMTDDDLADFNKSKLEKLLAEKEFTAQKIQERESFVKFEKKASAPSNLPILDEPVLPEALKKDSEAKKEPTPEEVKERLNKLLAGDM